MGELTPKKIAFEGPPSSGKTTLFKKYQQRFSEDPSVKLVAEGAREFFEKHPTPDRSTETQRRIQDFVQEREKEATTDPQTELIITDRSVVAPYVIATFYGEADADTLDPSSEMTESYAHFVLFSPEGIIYEKDPHRKETPAERLKMRDAYQTFFEERGLPYTEVSGTVEERIEQVDRIIYEKKPKNQSQNP